jgi:hypothetical protein
MARSAEAGLLSRGRGPGRAGSSSQNGVGAASASAASMLPGAEAGGVSMVRNMNISLVAAAAEI